MAVVFFASNTMTLNAGPFCVYMIVTLLSGAAITAVGVGGVLLMPFMLLLLDAAPAVGAASTMASMLPLGIVAAAANARQGGIPRRPCVVLLLSAFPGAVAGALLLPHVPGVVLSSIVSAVALLSGLRSLYKEARTGAAAAGGEEKSDAKAPQDVDTAATTSTILVQKPVAVKINNPMQKTVPTTSSKASGDDTTATTTAQKERPPRRRRPLTGQQLGTLAAIGVVAGVVSLLTVSGGPFAILPLSFIFLGDALAVKEVVAMAICASVVITATATVVSATSATVDLGLALAMGGAQVFGVPLGMWVARKVSERRLKAAIAVILVLVGGVSLVRTAMKHI